MLHGEADARPKLVRGNGGECQRSCGGDLGLSREEQGLLEWGLVLRWERALRDFWNGV